METIKINDIEYVKKEELDNLLKEQKSTIDYVIQDDCNVSGIIKIPQDNQLKLIRQGKEEILKPEEIIVLKDVAASVFLIYKNKELWGVYDTQFLRKAKKLFRAWDSLIFTPEAFLISDYPHSRCCIHKGNFGFLIASRYSPDEINKYDFKELNKEVKK